MFTVTPEGKRLFVAVFVTGFASLNTGNNLMYMIFAMLTSILLLSLIIPYINLRGITASLKFDEPVYARTPALAGVTIVNHKKKFSSYSFRFSIPLIDDKGLYIEKIDGRSKITKTHRLLFPSRGAYSLMETILSTQFPFIFFYHRKKPQGENTLLVYPEIFEVKEKIDAVTTAVAEVQRQRSARGEEFFYIREFEYGDDVRNIHWKATAKRGDVMVKEHSLNEPDKITLVLDNISYERDDHFEKAVSFAASMATALLTNGFSIAFITGAESIPVGSGMAHKYKILDLLALLRQQKIDDCLFEEPTGSSFVLILSSKASPLSKLSSFASKTYYVDSL